MNECVSCQENKIVSPAKVIANKLCTPNQIHFEYSSSRPQNVWQRVVNRWQERLYSRVTKRVLKDLPGSPLSIRNYIERRDARLLFIVRDCNQVIDSIIRRGGESERKAMSRWAYGIGEMYTSYLEYKKRTHLLTFRNLVNQTRGELKDVAEFLELEYNPVMMNGYETNPTYNKEKVDSSVSNKQPPDYGMDSKFPESYEMYRRLVRWGEKKVESSILCN